MSRSSALAMPAKGRLALLFVVALLAAAPSSAAAATCTSGPLLTAAQLSGSVPCTQAKPNCVARVIREMTKRFDVLAAGCDHDAVFSLVYLRTTEEFERALNEPGFFLDPDYLIRQDVHFANYYFEAYDAWHAGQPADAPEAWRIAFEAADERAVSGAGNILLGMNAHVNRDLPYVLADLGLYFPDGSSRKPDHDKVNVFLRRVMRPALDEVARRFDPSVKGSDIPGTTLDDEVLFQMLVGWREQAWHNAVRLVGAKTPEERLQVEASIEAYAAEMARLIREQSAYHPPLTTSAARDAWCAAHWNDDGTTTSALVASSLTAPTLMAQTERLRDGLSAAYPNPFNPQTSFVLSVAAAQQVRVEVVDLLGRRVALLHDGLLEAGPDHRFTFDAAHLPSGRYLIRATGDRFAEQMSVVLTK